MAIIIYIIVTLLFGFLAKREMSEANELSEANVEDSDLNEEFDLSEEEFQEEQFTNTKPKITSRYIRP